MTTIDDISHLPHAEFAEEVEEHHDERYVSGGAFIFDQPDEIPARWGDGEQILWAKGEALMLCGPQGLGRPRSPGKSSAGYWGCRTTSWGTAWPQQRGSCTSPWTAPGRSPAP